MQVWKFLPNSPNSHAENDDSAAALRFPSGRPVFIIPTMTPSESSSAFKADLSHYRAQIRRSFRARCRLHGASALSLSVILPALLVQTGCRAPAEMSGPTEIVLSISDRDRFVDNTLTLLRENDFAPQRVDRGAGRIVAGPTTGAQWFEFWRSDSQGPYQLLESSMHTTQRVVTVQFEPLSTTTQAAEAAAQSYRVNVQVDKLRYNAPERQITTASGALQIYSEKIPTTEGLRKASTAGEAWIPVGRDGLLESFLLQRIARLPSVDAESPID